MALGAAPTLTGAAKEATDGFGPLNTILRSISTAHANREVRL